MTEKKYIGVDIGGTAIKTGIIDESGAVLSKTETEIDQSCERESVMQTVARSIREIASAADMEDFAFAGIGVSAPGSIDTVRGKVAINGGNVPGWSGTEVCSALRAEFELPVAVANDGNCTALAEAWVGAARGCSDVLCVALGTGIGGGIVSGGRLIGGARGFAGEIGHFTTHAGGRECICGGRGCFERYAATSALVNEGQTMRPEWISGRAIFKDANEGDKEALSLIDRWTDEIALGIASLVHIFNPEVVLIGGGVSVQDELVIKPLAEKVRSRIMPDFAEGLTIRRAELGNDAGMVGAVKNLVNRMCNY